MDFAHMDGTYLLVAAVFLVLIGAQSWLVNRERGWLGVFVPSIYFGILMFLGITGRVSSLADFVFAALGLLGLLAWWISVREARRRSIEERSELERESAMESAVESVEFSSGSISETSRYWPLRAA